MKKFDSQKSQKFMEGFVKVGKIVLKAALAIGSVAILSKINDELGQLGIKVDLNGGDISVETKKKDGRGLGLFIAAGNLKYSSSRIRLLNERNQFGNLFKFEIDVSQVMQ